MNSIHDDEFGEITIRRSAKARHVRLRVAPDGRLRASLPPYTPLFLLKKLLKSSRTELRQMLAETQQDTLYHPGQQIGKSHTLIVKHSAKLEVVTHRVGQQVIVELPETIDFMAPTVQRAVRDAVIKALRLEAKSYLPKRLGYLAEQLGYRYEKVRFSHASGRWGSCSTSGTISLNIALMKLPFELIDYVLIHELSHTVEMNHSEKFWSRVEAGDPEFRTHRKMLKLHTPSI